MLSTTRRVMMSESFPSIGALFVRADCIDAARLEIEFYGPFTKVMKRLREESVAKTLMRIQKSLAQPATKTKPKRTKRHGGEGSHSTDQEKHHKEQNKKQQKTSNIFVLDRDGNEMDPSSFTNEQVFCKDGKFLVVEDLGAFEMVRNPPIIKNLTLKGYGITNCPLAPVVETEFANEVRQIWTWRSGESIVGNERVFNPTQDLVGKPLSVECTLDTRYPTTARIEVEGVVMQEPERQAIVERQRTFSDRSGHEQRLARVVTYNVLADAYSHTWDDMYSYCKVEHRDIQYRLPLLMREVLDYEADIVCLQEVDTKVFEFWSSCLEEWFDSKYTSKAGDVREGCATFWRRSKFKCTFMEEFAFRDLVKTVDDPWLSDLCNAVDELEMVLQKVTTIAQLFCLEQVSDSGPRNALVLSNTHSFYHPGAGNVRAIQAKLLVEKLEAKIAEEKAARGGTETHVGAIMCGDFNAQSFDLSIAFLLSGSVSADHPEWATSSLFQWDSKANLARDKVFEEEGDKQRYPDILVQKTPSGRMRSVDELRAQVEAIDASHSWSDKINVVVELKHLLEFSSDLDRHEDCAALRRLLATMQDHLEADRQKLIAQQKDLVQQDSRKELGDTTIGLGVNLQHGLHFFSACGEPKYTNYCRSWYGDIDWILLSHNELECVDFAEIPNEEIVSRHVALPSVAFPSDHISLCCDIRWKKQQT